ncbi:MAG: Nif3-like dinuclear metal center hexameric protein [Oscillospiraceae bacterium]|jgi:dinuclear metal center YbgI/SA1388 family protein|nr:Nif3-like dinuclear metal center hexameric protein [Oscillospiraceae bacterium]
MTDIQDIFQAVDAYAPFESAEDFDNVGLLVGEMGLPVSRCLVALDVMPATVSEALAKGCELILSHHPVIFNPLRQVGHESTVGQLLRAGVSVISAHTNVDKAGLNSALAEILGIRELKPLAASGGCAGVGLPPEKRKHKNAWELALLFKEKLGVQGFRCYDAGGMIGRVALCCGGGGSYLKDAIEAGADCFVTGDLRHNHVVEAAAAGISLIDLGHFETEVHFIPLMIGLLQPQLPDVEFLPAESSKPLFAHG